ncbi:hypothetical protein DFA_05912 [Cavenderia fasciculata]|uniref:Uncharacterized protein n=1 Tax=Cavenderia fasciculata TaxID=261658 RepID=F4PJK2_CACFS|nr:uncharacterized protein DFA_05912 [Cavenderia fasciculata]EGG23776.1 hypothetical protein DFA_05912 [Cavenderia fasciculata]|eukprot:XP_004361627.1 hypothetical protein DFA_05912 [Cavenderia fasciculata]
MKSLFIILIISIFYISSNNAQLTSNSTKFYFNGEFSFDTLPITKSQFIITSGIAFITAEKGYGDDKLGWTLNYDLKVSDENKTLAVNRVEIGGFAQKNYESSFYHQINASTASVNTSSEFKLNVTESYNSNHIISSTINRALEKGVMDSNDSQMVLVVSNYREFKVNVTNNGTTTLQNSNSTTYYSRAQLYAGEDVERSGAFKLVSSTILLLLSILSFLI